MVMPQHTDTPFLSLVAATAPKSVADMAKLLIWAFIAGFAERLVPDQISKLIGKSGAGKEGAATS
jgi:hypothetical protein